MGENRTIIGTVKTDITLDEVKKIPHGPRRERAPHLSKEVILGWLKDEITLSQITKAIGLSHPRNLYVRLIIDLKNLFRRGELKIT